MADELDESNVALTRAMGMTAKSDSDIRVKFCTGMHYVLTLLTICRTEYFVN